MADDRNQISPGARLAFLREAFRNREAAAQARDLAAATELTDVRTEYIAQGRRFDEMADRLERLANGASSAVILSISTRGAS
jgi:hypothetical protein